MVLGVVVGIFLSRIFGISFTKHSGSSSATDDKRKKAGGIWYSEVMSRVTDLYHKDKRFGPILEYLSKEQEVVDKGGYLPRGAGEYSLEIMKKMRKSYPNDTDFIARINELKNAIETARLKMYSSSK